jgi:hypothetical protein
MLLTAAVVQYRGTRNHRDSGRVPRPTCSVTSGTRPVLFGAALLLLARWDSKQGLKPVGARVLFAGLKPGASTKH